MYMRLTGLTSLFCIFCKKNFLGVLAYVNAAPPPRLDGGGLAASRQGLALLGFTLGYDSSSSPCTGLTSSTMMTRLRSASKAMSPRLMLISAALSP